jgi:hypothetical protein
MHTQKYKSHIDSDGSDAISSFSKWAKLNKIQMVVVYDGTSDIWSVTFADPHSDIVILGQRQDQSLSSAVYSAFTAAKAHIKP